MTSHQNALARHRSQCRTRHPRLCASCCCFTYYTKVLEQGPTGLQHRYTIRAGTACCGRVNNCCGATCCKNNLIMDVLDAEGKLVSTIQKTYAPSGNAGACCRMLFEFKWVMYRYISIRIRWKPVQLERELEPYFAVNADFPHSNPTAPLSHTLQ